MREYRVFLVQRKARHELGDDEGREESRSGKWIERSKG